MGSCTNEHASLQGSLSVGVKKKAIQGNASLNGNLSLMIIEGTKDYNELENLPTINGVLVKGDLTQDDLHIKAGYDAFYDAENENLILS